MMYRITDYRYAEAIGVAFNLLPLAVASRLNHIDFLTGTDPVYAGLHNHIKTRNGRFYRNTAHVSFPWNAINKRGKTTVVLPTPRTASPYIVIHELGHCLHELLGFRHIALPINAYAKTNKHEAFAEAFAAQYFRLGIRAEDIFQSDEATQVLFKELARWH